MNKLGYKLFAYTCHNDRVWFDKPRWIDIAEWFEPVFQKGGCVRIDSQEPMPGKISKLSVRADAGRFLLIATVHSEMGDLVIRWREPEGSPDRGMVDVGGDEWDARSVLTDISIAVRVFKETFDTGELSEESMRHMR